MITIAIDEQGDFNFLNLNGNPDTNNKNAQFIAGIVYDDLDDPQDANFERQRLDRFFRAVAKDYSYSYPESFYTKIKGFVTKTSEPNLPEDIEELNLLDLSAEKETNKPNPYAEKFTVTDKEKAKYTDAVSAALPEFFEHGTYFGKELIPVPRKGYYSIAVMLKSQKGKRMFLDEGAGMLINDDIGSNLYWHMVDSTLARLVFHNPYHLDVKRVEFNLPTRITEVNQENVLKLEEFRVLGYKDYTFPRGKKPDSTKDYFQVVNEFTYRAALDRRVIDYDRLDIDIKTFKALSINYSAKGIKETEKYAFLYLANFLCGYFRRYGALNTSLSDMKRFKEFKDLIDELNGRAPNLLFTYDDIDDLFEKAMVAYERKHYVEALEYIYDGKHSDSYFADYYSDEWFPHIEELIHGEMDLRGIERAIQDLSYYAEAVNCNADKLLYLFEHLEQLVLNLENKQMLDGHVAYTFYDAGMTAFNHVGNSKLAAYCFNKCQELSKYVPLETYLLTLKRRVVSLTDEYRYNDAVEIAERIVNMEERIQCLRAELEGKAAKPSISLGQAYSQLGQVYAYLQRSEAEENFRNALAIFDDKSADAYRTQSYLLHYYIEVGDKKSYEELAYHYFGECSELNDQLSYIVSLSEEEHDVQALAYALFVYVKAVYVLYKNHIDNTFIVQLKAAEKEIKRTNPVHNHPWELIYTYLSFIALEVKENPIALVWRDKIKNSIINPGNSIQCSILYGLVQFHEKIGDTQQAQLYRKQLVAKGIDVRTAMTYMNR